MNGPSVNRTVKINGLNLEQAAQTMANPEEFVPGYSEGALEVIENILTDGHLLWEAVNIPNQGQITNLPMGAIIELPGILHQCWRHYGHSIR
jgi:alpha-galactosidase/6-phospho-beta-glucosidase family protein